MHTEIQKMWLGGGGGGGGGGWQGPPLNAAMIYVCVSGCGLGCTVHEKKDFFLFFNLIF